MKDRNVQISPDVLFQEVSGEMVLLDLGSEHYFGLDEIGARIWSLLESGAGEAAVVDTLLEEYDVERETLQADVAELLDQLTEAGLVAIVQQ